MMARAVPSKEELSKALIVNVISGVIGIVLGMVISAWWENHQTVSKGIQVPGSGYQP